MKLQIENLGIEFGGSWLLKGASYQFLPGERIGLIGRNGAGKSTLLKILAGQLTPSEGQVHKAGGTKIAYFHQDLLSFETDRSIEEVVLDAFQDLLDMKAEIDALLNEFDSGNVDSDKLDRLQALQDEFDLRGGANMEASVHSVLSGLGFEASTHSNSYSTFSGGWRMRVLLAQMLLTEPDILMLDEPTNHLDLPAIQWLEGYLKSFSGTCIVVSHDRFFIDRIAKRILEISLKKIHTYTGNYSYYLKEKALRTEQQERDYESQQRYIAEQEKLINRFRAKASKAKMAQSRIKALERLDRVEAPEEERAKMRIRFEMANPSGKEVMALKCNEKAYGDKKIIESSQGLVMRGDKIALIGANGLGKSTLLRILAGTESFEGERKEGHNVDSSFFAQHQLEALDLKNNILEEIQTISSGKTETELRSVLGCFMFSGDTVDKKVAVLSGGEKSRVAMAKVLVSKANFLLLDEPTNHLDIQSIEVLIDALNAFEGTYVLVSHDRHFLSKVANKIWYIEDLKIKEYPGNYLEFESWYADRNPNQSVEVDDSKIESSSKAPKTGEDKLDYKTLKRMKNRHKKCLRDQEIVEEKIETLETELSSLENEMASSEIASNFSLLQEKEKELSQKQTELSKLTEEWETVLTEIEKLEKSLDL